MSPEWDVGCFVSLLRRYGWVPVAVGIALWISMAVHPLLGERLPFAPFYIAVVCMAVLRGLGPGVAAAILGAVAAIYFELPPVHSLVVSDHEDQIGLALYFVVSAVMLVFVESLRTARHRAQTAESAERLQKQWLEVTLSSIGDGVIATDAEGIITFINPVACLLTGWRRDDALGVLSTKVFAIQNEETGAVIDSPLAQAILEARVIGLANHSVLVSRDGRRVPIDDSGAPIINAAGKVIGAVLIFRDVSEARAKDAELRRRGRMIDLSHDAVIVADAERRIVSWNQGAAELYGFTANEAQGRMIHELLRTVGATPPRHIDETLRERGRWDGELQHTCKDGRLVVSESRQVLLRDAQGAITGILEINRDVTERKRAEQVLRESENKLRTVVEALPVGVWLLDAKGTIEYGNPAGRQIWGGERLVGLDRYGDFKARWLDSGKPLESSEWAASLAMQGHPVLNQVLEIEAFDGTRKVVKNSAVPILSESGQVTGVVVTNEDITGLMQAEEATRLARARLDLTLDAANLGLWYWDLPDGKLVWNEKCRLLYGMAPGEEPSYELAMQLTHPEDRARVRSTIQAAIEDGTGYDIEYRVIASDGITRWIRAVGRLSRDSHGRPTHLDGIVMDITEQKRREEASREAQKLESIGLLAGGIAHDFNNLLTGVIGNASLLIDRVAGDPTARGYTESVIFAAERAAKLTQQILAYSGRGRFVIEPVDLSGQMRDTVPLVRASISKKIDVRFDLPDGLPPVEADVVQIQQLMMNLVLNGAEAIGPEGGLLHLSTRAETLDDDRTRALGLGENLRPGVYVCLEVRDTGCGMDETVLSRMFDPFFTTKFTGRGLGLSAVQGIVRGHGGAIQVTSKPGAGTTFRVFLPSIASSAAPAPKPSGARESHGAGAILVVDDEPIIRSTAQAALERLGYRVLTAADGGEAVKTFAAEPSVSAILLDMTMPGLSGEETLQQLRAIRPDVPVILSTGFSEAEAMFRFGKLNLQGFLQKPYTVATLSNKLSAMVRGSTATGAE